MQLECQKILKQANIDVHGSPSSRMPMGFNYDLHFYRRQARKRPRIKLVEYTGRLFRHGKASNSAELAGIFERIGCSAQSWQSRMEKLRDGRLLGRFFATTRAKLREIAERLGMQRPVNVVGYPV